MPGEAPGPSRHPVVRRLRDVGLCLGQDLLHTVTAVPPALASPLEGPDTADRPAVAGVWAPGRPRQAEVDTGQAGSLLLYHSLHVLPVPEPDGQLVDQHPDEDEEEAAHHREQSEAGVEGVSAVSEDGEVEDLVESSSEAGEDDSQVIELPGEEEEPLLCPDPEYEEEAGEQSHEGDHQHGPHHSQAVHHRLHLEQVELLQPAHHLAVLHVTEDEPYDSPQPHHQVDGSEDDTDRIDGRLQLAAVPPENQLHGES